MGVVTQKVRNFWWNTNAAIAVHISDYHKDLLNFQLSNSISYFHFRTSEFVSTNYRRYFIKASNWHGSVVVTPCNFPFEVVLKKVVSWPYVVFIRIRNMCNNEQWSALSTGAHFIIITRFNDRWLSFSLFKIDIHPRIYRVDMQPDANTCVTLS